MIWKRTSRFEKGCCFMKIKLYSFKTSAFVVISLCCFLLPSNAQKLPSSMKEFSDEPVIYIGERQPDKRFYDGRLPHAVGVHHFQVMRANRTHSPVVGDSLGWTYNHQPFLAYWNGTFYLQYLSDLVQEHTPPGRTLLMTSKDGRIWSKPVVVFPVYTLPEINYKGQHLAAGMKSVMHQRMGFYVAPNGRLLTLAFYSYCATPRNSPNAGDGLGRVVREIYKDGSFGPIYFIRYNRHAGWNESNTNYPFYKTSTDKGFLQACDALLADKLITLQWWEEDRGKDGFFALDPGDVKNAATFSANVTTSAGAGKAFCFYHRPDGKVVGLWKNQFSALSTDDGTSWTPITQNKTLWTCGAKTWGQRTDDGRYAIVHDHSATRRNRFPMVIMSSDDGHIFDDLLCLRGEVPPKRFQGLHKNTGPQYFRGIIEGNGNPPGKEMWITYSVNKEDIWIAKVHIPVSGKVDEEVNQDFENVTAADDLDLWNLYIPQRAPINVISEPGQNNKCLELRDEDPYDYAKAERIFPQKSVLKIQFRFNARNIVQGHALEIEVQDIHGTRPMRLRIDQHWLSLDRKQVFPLYPLPIGTNKWYKVTLQLDCNKQSYNLALNGQWLRRDIAFAEKVDSLQRIVFRTGPYRGYVPPDVVDEGAPKPAGLNSEDLPCPDEKVPACVYWIDDVRTGAE